MAEQSNIEWTDATWNPWSGCMKVSSGCLNCYMHRDKHRWSGDTKAGSELQVASDRTFNMPLRLKEPALVFTCSMSDFFEPRADAFRAEAWEIIKKTPHLTYQILTKRPERVLEHLPADWGSGYDNVWLGVSIENNDTLGRGELLLKLPAKVRFISYEPLLEWIFYPVTEGIDWAIIGGESGNENGPFGYRKTKLKWINNLVALLEADNTPVFVKQLGTGLAKELGLKDRHGRDINEFPEYLQRREMPKAYDEVQLLSFWHEKVIKGDQVN
jgi:protein gp37